MDFSGPAPLGSQAILMALPQPRRDAEVRAIDPGSASTGAGNDAGQSPEQDDTAAAARDIIALRQETARNNLPVGPPPSFEVSMLEMQSDLRQVLARLEVARNQERDAEALRVSAQSDQAEASAEVADLTASLRANAESDTPSATATGSGPQDAAA